MNTNEQQRRMMMRTLDSMTIFEIRKDIEKKRKNLHARNKLKPYTVIDLAEQFKRSAADYLMIEDET